MSILIDLLHACAIVLAAIAFGFAGGFLMMAILHVIGWIKDRTEEQA